MPSTGSTIRIIVSFNKGDHSPAHMATPRRRQVQNRGRLRIIGGRWKRHTLKFAGGTDLRPTPDAVRETLFNWLTPSVGQTRCLDLFAGSGALGFEAASRGATRVVMVDNNRHCCRQLEENRSRLGADQISIYCDDALRWLRNCSEPFDIIFLDPPYASQLTAASFNLLDASRIVRGGLVYVETGADRPLAVPDHWIEKHQQKAGEVCYRLYQVDGSSEGNGHQSPSNIQ